MTAVGTELLARTLMDHVAQLELGTRRERVCCQLKPRVSITLRHSSYSGVNAVGFRPQKPPGATARTIR